MTPDDGASPRKTQKRTTIIIIAIVTSILVLIAVAMYSIWKFPKEKDYDTAKAKIETIIERQKKIEEEGSRNDQKTLSEVTYRISFKKNVLATSADIKELGQLKAVTNDKEVYDAYKKFLNDYPKYVEQSEMITELYATSIAVDTEGALYNVADSNGMRNFAKRYRSVASEAKYKINKEYLNTIADYRDKLADAYDLCGGSSCNEYSSEYDKMLEYRGSWGKQLNQALNAYNIEEQLRPLLATINSQR